VLGIVLATVLGWGNALPAFASEMHRFDIPAQAASEAIDDFASQARVQILVAGEKVKDKQLRALSGEYSTQEGLALLLANSGLEPKYVGDRSIALVSAGAAGERSTAVPKLEAESKRSFWDRFRLAQADQADDAASRTSPPAPDAEVVVTGVQVPVTTSTGLPLTFMETPQSVTIIDQKRIQDFRLTSSKDLLDQVVGVNVDRYETDRTSFTARGFDVTNFQINGIGLPLINNVFYADTDSFLYERVDIIRGASGLTTGIGNPSATINYVRKRPLDHTRVNAAGHFGSWGGWRVEADASVPINDEWGIRFIGAHEDSDGYLDNYSFDRDVYGIVASGRITPALTLTAGYNRQDHKSIAATWVGLPLVYSDGTFIDFDRSDNTAPDWANWPTTEQQAYAELSYAIGEWTINGVMTYRNFKETPTIVNAWLPPDRVTGNFFGDTSKFRTDNDRYLADLYASGVVSAFGREHKLTMGLSYADSHQMQYQGRATDTGNGLGYVQYPDFNGPSRFDVQQPAYNALALAQDQKDKLLRAYIASQINFTDRFHVVAGASWADSESSGINYGEIVGIEQSEFNPYAGALFDITPSLTAYASYTAIFNPQGQYDISHVQLDPIEGVNIEGGIKASLFEHRFYVTATMFETQQNGLASFVGSVADPVFGNFFYYEGVDTTAKGFEIETAGRVTPNWEISGGYSKLTSLEDESGAETREFIPRQTLKLSSTYNVPALRGLSVGAQVRWQDDIETPTYFPGVVVSQPAYTIVDLMAGIDLTEKVRTSFVVRNVTDELYYTTMIYGGFAIGQYAAPRSYNASVSFRF
jgi:outer membrane receptor for ferric coprogen and ferric-rhodotorulic acid